jgi:hypothetical protein
MHEKLAQQQGDFGVRRLSRRFESPDASGHFIGRAALRTEIVPRYQRRLEAVDEALRALFLAGISQRRAGEISAQLFGAAVSATTVSNRRTALRGSWRRVVIIDCLAALWSTISSAFISALPTTACAESSISSIAAWMPGSRTSGGR